MLPYAACLTMRVVADAKPPLEEGKPPPGCELPYHVRVVIPCYKEPLEVISKTVMASLYAVLPPGCQRTGERGAAATAASSRADASRLPGPPPLPLPGPPLTVASLPPPH